MKLNNLTASAFALEIGVQASSVSHILSGRNKPSLEFIQKVLVAYPKIDSNWLISGTTKIAAKPDPVEEKAEEVEEKALPKKNQLPSKVTKSDTNEKTISKVLIFYNDGTFEEFLSATNSDS